MTEYQYRAAPARAAVAAALRGRIEAADEVAARRALRDQGLVPIEVRPVAFAERLRLGGRQRGAVGNADRLWFFRTLDRFLSRSAPLEEAVSASVELARTPPVKAAAQRVLEQLRQGRSLADACQSVPGLVLPRHAALLRVGHASGRLPRAAALVASSLESSARMRKQIAGQMIYPAVVLVTAFICVWILATIVVPRIAEQLNALGTELPAATQVTLAGTRAFVWVGPLLLLLLAGAYMSWRRGVISVSAKERVQVLAWRIPVWRDLLWNARGGAAVETVATLLEGGGELLEGLELAVDAAGDPVISKRLLAARSRIREGADPAEAMALAAVLPPEPAAVLRIGSRSGDLTGGLHAAARTCGEQRETLAGRLTTLINPAVMLLMGAVVGWLFYSLLAGMLAINDAGTL